MSTWQHINRFSLVLLPLECQIVMETFKQDTFKKSEAGGILLGHRRGSHFEIITITTPGPKDICTRTSFHRKDPSHQLIATTLWSESGWAIDYIGEWHTHPEIKPRPSEVDIKEWQRATIDYKKPLIGLIIGLEQKYLGWVDPNGVKEMQLVISKPEADS